MKKHIDVIISGLWFAFLVVLMLRMPVVRVLQEPAEGFSVPDLALSALFCLTGIVSSVLAYAFSKRQLFALSLVNILLFVAMLALFVVSGLSGNRAMLDFSMYFVNLFCFVLSFEGNMIAYCSAFLVLQILVTVLFSFLLKIKKEK